MPVPGPIEHVVVLMLENRSFDHMLGLLDYGGLVPVTEEPIPNPINPSDPTSEVALAFALDEEGGLDADPKHGYPDVMRQLSANAGPWQAPYELTNSGFAWNYQERRQAPGKQVLGCHTPELLPVLSTLAREYAVCSRWHCSVPSETWPNRLFAHAATSDDLVENEIRFYDNRTIFEVLSSAGRSWQIYAGDIPQVAAYPELHFHDGGFRFSRLGSFFEHARDGRLPNYSFIEPRHFGSAVSSQHPLASVSLGERLLREVYMALASNAKIWSTSLLVITYDEHGGFFDRVSPTAAVPPRVGARDPTYGFAFDLLGPRVPAVVVSSRIEPGTVHDEVLDHTSIAATLRELFDFDATLTDRDSAATSFARLASRPQPLPPVDLPTAPETIPAAQGPEIWAEGVAPDGTIELNEFQQGLVELAVQIDRERPSPELIDGVESPPVPEPEFRSETELGEFIEAFRRRHLDQI
ncbi:MAG TPA: alkaline phosphatase family protein [Gaiellaceae bacterium]|nr:alkaline phosphatase family protein [Gaiellaceae bacterium]